MGEFFESEIVFSDSDYDSDTNRQLVSMTNDAAPHRRIAGKVYRSSRSIPAAMEIPSGNFSSSSGGSSPSSAKAVFRRQMDLNILIDNEWLDRDGEDDDMMVPPHLIVARRINLENSRLASGLKGRDLNRVRNSILRMTGFLEQ